MKRTIFSLFFLLLWISHLRAQAPFYEGKRITLIAATTSDKPEQPAKGVTEAAGLAEALDGQTTNRFL